MIRLDRCAEIEASVATALDRYPAAERPKRWDGKAKAVKAFLRVVMEQGLAIQFNRCAWCLLPVGEAGRRTAHRDHVAPKVHHPQWTFLPKNLVIACEFCNGFAVKGDVDTVAVAAENYEDCEFHVVHPYLDNPRDHVQFLSEDDGMRIAIRALSDKGRWTVLKLKLDTPGATLERAKEFLHASMAPHLAPRYRQLLDQALVELR